MSISVGSSSQFKMFPSVNNNDKMQEAMKKQGLSLRSTNCPGVYCDYHNPSKPAGDYSCQRHFVWNDATETFEELGVYYITSNGNSGGAPVKNGTLQAKLQGYNLTSEPGVYEKDGKFYSYNEINNTFSEIEVEYTDEKETTDIDEKEGVPTEGDSEKVDSKHAPQNTPKIDEKTWKEIQDKYVKGELKLSEVLAAFEGKIEVKSESLAGSELTKITFEYDGTKYTWYVNAEAENVSDIDEDESDDNQIYLNDSLIEPLFNDEGALAAAGFIPEPTAEEIEEIASALADACKDAVENGTHDDIYKAFNDKLQELVAAHVEKHKNDDTEKSWTLYDVNQFAHNKIGNNMNDVITEIYGDTSSVNGGDYHNWVNDYIETLFNGQDSINMSEKELEDNIKNAFKEFLIQKKDTDDKAARSAQVTDTLTEFKKQLEGDAAKDFGNRDDVKKLVSDFEEGTIDKEAFESGLQAIVDEIKSVESKKRAAEAEEVKTWTLYYVNQFAHNKIGNNMNDVITEIYGDTSSVNVEDYHNWVDGYIETLFNGQDSINMSEKELEDSIKNAFKDFLVQKKETDNKVITSTDDIDFSKHKSYDVKGWDKVPVEYQKINAENSIKDWVKDIQSDIEDFAKNILGDKYDENFPKLFDSAIEQVADKYKAAEAFNSTDVLKEFANILDKKMKEFNTAEARGNSGSSEQPEPKTLEGSIDFSKHKSYDVKGWDKVPVEYQKINAENNIKYWVKDIQSDIEKYAKNILGNKYDENFPKLFDSAIEQVADKYKAAEAFNSTDVLKEFAGILDKKMKELNAAKADNDSPRTDDLPNDDIKELLAPFADILNKLVEAAGKDTVQGIIDDALKMAKAVQDKDIPQDMLFLTFFMDKLNEFAKQYPEVFEQPAGARTRGAAAVSDSNTTVTTNGDGVSTTLTDSMGRVIFEYTPENGGTYNTYNNDNNNSSYNTTSHNDDYGNVCVQITQTVYGTNGDVNNPETRVTAVSPNTYQVAYRETNSTDGQGNNINITTVGDYTFTRIEEDGISPYYHVTDNKENDCGYITEGIYQNIKHRYVDDDLLDETNKKRAENGNEEPINHDEDLAIFIGKYTRTDISSFHSRDDEDDNDDDKFRMPEELPDLTGENASGIIDDMKDGVGSSYEASIVSITDDKEVYEFKDDNGNVIYTVEITHSTDEAGNDISVGVYRRSDGFTYTITQTSFGKAKDVDGESRHYTMIIEISDSNGKTAYYVNDAQNKMLNITDFYSGQGKILDCSSGIGSDGGMNVVMTIQNQDGSTTEIDVVYDTKNDNKCYRHNETTNVTNADGSITCTEIGYKDFTRDVEETKEIWQYKNANDKTGRLIYQGDKKSGMEVEYIYNDDNYNTPVSKIVRETNGDIVTTTIYKGDDENNNEPLSVTVEQGGKIIKEITYTYGEQDVKTEVIYDENEEVVNIYETVTADKSVTTTTYDANHNMLKETYVEQYTKGNDKYDGYRRETVCSDNGNKTITEIYYDYNNGTLSVKGTVINEINYTDSTTVSRKQYELDSNGNKVLTYESIQDTNGNDIATIEYSYDETGKLTTTVVIEYAQDGSGNYSITTTNEKTKEVTTVKYDKDGNKIENDNPSEPEGVEEDKETQDADETEGSDEADKAEETEGKEEQGSDEVTDDPNKTGVISSVDVKDDNGNVIGQEVTTREFDENGNEVLITKFQRNDGKEFVDEEIVKRNGVEIRYTEYNYDGDKLIYTQSTHKRDDNTVYSIVYTDYSNYDNGISSTVTTNYGADGTTVTGMQLETEKKQSDGNIIIERYECAPNGNLDDAPVNEVVEINKDGEVIKRTEYTRDENGVVIATTVITVDENYNTIETTTLKDGTVQVKVTDKNGNDITDSYNKKPDDTDEGQDKTDDKGNDDSSEGAEGTGNGDEQVNGQEEGDQNTKEGDDKGKNDDEEKGNDEGEQGVTPPVDDTVYDGQVIPEVVVTGGGDNEVSWYDENGVYHSGTHDEYAKSLGYDSWDAYQAAKAAGQTGNTPGGTGNGDDVTPGNNNDSYDFNLFGDEKIDNMMSAGLFLKEDGSFDEEAFLEATQGKYGAIEYDVDTLEDGTKIVFIYMSDYITTIDIEYTIATDGTITISYTNKEELTIEDMCKQFIQELQSARDGAMFGQAAVFEGKMKAMQEKIQKEVMQKIRDEYISAFLNGHLAAANLLNFLSEFSGTGYSGESVTFGEGDDTKTLIDITSSTIMNYTSAMMDQDAASGYNSFQQFLRWADRINAMEYLVNNCGSMSHDQLEAACWDIRTDSCVGTYDWLSTNNNLWDPNAYMYGSTADTTSSSGYTGKPYVTGTRSMQDTFKKLQEDILWKFIQSLRNEGYRVTEYKYDTHYGYPHLKITIDGRQYDLNLDQGFPKELKKQIPHESIRMLEDLRNLTYNIINIENAIKVAEIDYYTAMANYTLGEINQSEFDTAKNDYLKIIKLYMSTDKDYAYYYYNNGSVKSPDERGTGSSWDNIWQAYSSYWR